MNGVMQGKAMCELATLSTRALWCCAVWMASHDRSGAESRLLDLAARQQAARWERVQARPASQPPS
ncbi:hypothetical protein [Aliidongia dinghuensis]|uniref:hypothetical protein n=1 Tax=Aliidongia dinghuensis TaxID=1867774 RepID=UPI00166375BB|nr:hypothetical protein [Aliidongia dinghuensis]